MVRVLVIDSRAAFDDACQALQSGSDSFAVDAERASGFTYSQRAFLIQVYRRGAGTFLFDPPALGDMSLLSDIAGDEEWIIHAASQDLACLREVGIRPRVLFDTELAARLLGFEKVGLGSVVSELLNVHLAKEHSAVDWSTRPLPEPWLEYAALDVELLVDLKDKLALLLNEASKLAIATEEFQATLDRPGKEAPAEPWRKLSGLHAIRTPRGMAMARELWLARDRLAAESDVAPGRLIPDSSIVAAVLENPASKNDLAKLKAFHGRASRTFLMQWWDALQAGATTTDLPELRLKSSEPPPPRSWPDRNPEAHARLSSVRPRIAHIAEETKIPVENLMSPQLIRQLAWEPPEPLSRDSVVTALLARGARAWQVEACVDEIVAAFESVDSPGNLASHSKMESP